MEKQVKLNILKKDYLKILKIILKQLDIIVWWLIEKNLSKNLIITAETKNKTIMGLMHKNYNIHGFQFHPESISTKVGMKLIKNFINN